MLTKGEVMYDEVILDKAVQIAAKNGWSGDIERSGYAPLVFNKDFARALWGETSDTMTVQNNTLNIKQVIDMDGWRYHMQQMVVSADPIQYLSNNMP